MIFDHRYLLYLIYVLIVNRTLYELNVKILSLEVDMQKLIVTNQRNEKFSKEKWNKM